MFGFAGRTRMRTLQTPRHRLSVYADADWGELYDLQEDPHELRNLWSDPAAAALRGELPMDLRRQQPLVELSEATRQDIQRICEAWADCRRRFGQDGPFLFGHASLADAFYAPVAARFRSYAVELPDIARTYVETIYQWPAFRAWYDAALREQAGS